MYRIIPLSDLNLKKSKQFHLLRTKSQLVCLFDVAKHYRSGKNNGMENRFHALSHVNIVFPLNTMTVIIGPSGAGKTTLLSLIGCMCRPSSGRIYVGEREVSSLPERFLAQIRQEHFGFVFQNLNLIQGISVLENTMLPTIPTSQKPAHVRTKALEILERLNIAAKASQKVQCLSGGEQQRVAIARALINAPDIIIADEPTAHLNTHLALEFLDIMNELQTEGKTIIIASHDPVLYESDKVNQVIELRDGQIVGFADISSLIN